MAEATLTGLHRRRLSDGRPEPAIHFFLNGRHGLAQEGTWMYQQLDALTPPLTERTPT